ncbi:probable leucine-rich repeat receptor-like serine/threonine-protein kinase At3g14840 isoform X2 [Vigna radiata var. radiata]|uniref:non-specific serine/threonine protein kinase n=1 Tax=Vigna radiata var. radiata TaxID=3916 RepID=A0A1S3VXF5_VIGRR|nr:probable leucine-rich repeat receptor-like serine/threonine-protein kinase At3g14840 isoform X2 [Vigna radiata var. radiata]
MARLTESVFGEDVAETLKSSLDPSSRLPPLMCDFSSFFSSLSIAMAATMNTTITSSQFFLILLLLPIFFIWLAFGGTLPENEVSVLKDIANTLGKKDWDFNVDPCNWTNQTIDNMISCNCHITNDTFCHIEKIALKSQSLQGVLPPQLNKLPYLQEIELSRNYISGSIPREWGSSNLQKMILEFNQLSGNLPSELGNLVLIKKLHLSSNNFTGPLPANLSRLTAMNECRISDNQFSGNIPDWLQNWTSLGQLHMLGSGLSGPIPPGISFPHLTDLRISDLNGPDSTFPPLENMKSLRTLILRSCNINDTFPQYLADLPKLKILDLSYNKLNGQVPRNLQQLSTAAYIYLTGNFFTGPVPQWTMDNNRSLDLSYNNFSVGNQEPRTCYQKNVNLFASFSRHNLGPVSCDSSNRNCTKKVTSLHINCGGNQTTIGGITYDEDIYPAGPAVYKQIGNNWALSNTGLFMDNDSLPQGQLPPYTTKNETRLDMTNAELYKNARVSPMSLSYYGFCLANGVYTVKLHFAEIMFTDDNTYSDLGRRVFDVYIQGKRVLKDFNIANEAQGVGKEVIKEFPAHVSDNDLEIRFYWAGKGTTYIPYKSVNGPLISAISVTYDGFSYSAGGTRTKEDSTGGMSAGVIVVIAVALVIVVILITVSLLRWRVFINGCCHLGSCWHSLVEGLRSNSNFRRHFGGNEHLSMEDFRDIELQTGIFTLHEIKVATNNFDISNKIGEGGFGPVYKGILPNGKPVAVKQLSSKSEQGTREFINEIGMISALQHPNLVKLYGCCAEGDQLLLVYEYMANNSLAHALFDSEDSHLKLNWATRKNICIGIARGLAFLHEETRLKVVHRDLKTSNVLLDEDLNPKISDFGLARLRVGENTHISTRIAGTWGYMAPEYAMHGYLTEKADVFSFGVVISEIVSGKRNTIRQSKGEAFYLLDWARLLNERGNIMELVDPKMNLYFNEDEVRLVVKVALHCTHVNSSYRPSMSSVLSMLEGRTMVPEFDSQCSEVMDEMKLEIMREYYSQMDENKTKNRRSLSLTKGVPWTDSSSTDTDINLAHLHPFA